MLRLAVKARSDTAGPEGLTSTALTLGMMPKMPIASSESLDPQQRERLAALERARSGMEAIAAELGLKKARRKREPELHPLNLNEGDPALAFRETPQRWKGPRKLVSQHSKNVTALGDNNKPHIFSMPLAKPFSAFLCATLASILAPGATTDLCGLEALMTNIGDCHCKQSQRPAIPSSKERGDAGPHQPRRLRHSSGSAFQKTRCSEEDSRWE
eukprot:Plantae.Rhodophyta-Hildenbrandia_rubra.ctg2137.p1 GENE.Plantae.Rhodophyta-Hildenbrandia_rubra.ctg2137~~Plantae.Rhodophyta-Hildenbrandia_rubra.ctg2137.p1  ORF type:complete len:214 (-),score=18.58 Plantae.Rhodophyta-Hildenbrandia_rubra.ctg2137:117-758(-)